MVYIHAPLSLEVDLTLVAFRTSTILTPCRAVYVYAQLCSNIFIVRHWVIQPGGGVDYILKHEWRYRTHPRHG